MKTAADKLVHCLRINGSNCLSESVINPTLSCVMAVAMVGGQYTQISALSMGAALNGKGHRLVV